MSLVDKLLGEFVDVIAWTDDTPDTLVFVQHVYQIDLRRIEAANRDAAQGRQEVVYLKCPVCSKIMNRVNFGQQSGVIVDRCRDHGVWLDAGELLHLMEWTKAGGLLLHQQALQRKAEAEARDRERSRREPQILNASELSSGRFNGADGDLLALLVRAVARLFS